MKKRTLLTAIITLVFSLAMLVGSSYAWFHKTIEIPDNTIRTGTLDVSLHIKDPDTTMEWAPITGGDNGGRIFDTNYLYPGYSTRRILKIENTGSIEAALKFTTKEVVSTNPEIKDAIKFSVGLPGKAAIVDETFGDVNEETYFILKPGQTFELELSYRIDGNLGNEGQNQWLTFEVNLLVLQGNDPNVMKGRIIPLYKD